MPTFKTFKTKDGKTVSFQTGQGRLKQEREAKARQTVGKLFTPIKKILPKRSARAPKRIKNISRSRARPKTKRGKTMAKKRRSRSHGVSTGGLTSVLLGGAVAGFVGSMIPYGNYGKLGAALVGHKQGGIIGNTAKALGVIGAANLVSGAGINASSAANGSAW